MVSFQLLFKKIGYNSSLIEEYYTKLKVLENGVSFCIHRSLDEYKFPKITHNIKQKLEMVTLLENDRGGLSHGLLNRKHYPIWFNDQVHVNISNGSDLKKSFLKFSGNFEDIILEFQNCVGTLNDYRSEDIFFEIKLLKKSLDRLEFESIVSKKMSDKYLSMIANSIARYENIGGQKYDFRFSPKVLPNKVVFKNELDLNKFLEDYNDLFSQQSQILVNKFKETNDLYYLIQIYSFSGWDNSNFI